MKILHLVPLIQVSTGGPSVSVTRLASEQAKLGHEVTLICLDYPHLGPQVTAEGVRLVSVKGNVFAVRGRGWSPGFRRVVMEEAKKVDVVHNHGLWMWPNAYAREAAVGGGKPLIISPRGMLESWSLNRSKLRKAVAWRLFEEKNLQSAAMFHATSEQEAESIRDAVKKLKDEKTKRQRWEGENVEKLESEVPIVVAPNGVDLPDLAQRPGREVLEDTFPKLKGRRWVVFMSRLHPKKGLDVLLRAWRQQQSVEHEAYGIRQTDREGEAERQGLSVEQYFGGTVEGGEQKTETLAHRNTETPHRGAVLVLAGSDLIGYRKDVERMVRELSLGDSVVMVGEVLGEAKDCLLAHADVFVLPSYSENFGIAIAEAMSWGRPVIASTGTPWKEIADVGAGWWVKPEEEPLTQVLHEALAKRPEELDAMGAKGRDLVAERYTSAVPAAKLVTAYSALTEAREQEIASIC